MYRSILGAILMSAAGTIVQTEEVAEAGIGGDWAAVLEHRRIPFVSYPYEWTFGMLKDAALLHLDLMQAALGEGMILKDSSEVEKMVIRSRLRGYQFMYYSVVIPAMIAALALAAAVGFVPRERGPIQVAALAAAVTTAGMAVAAALLAVLFGGESVASWIGDEEDGHE